MEEFTLVSALWLVAVTLALALGFWLGRNHAHSQYSDEKGYVHMAPTGLMSTSAGVCHARQAFGIMSQTPSPLHGGGAEEGDFIPEFVNQGFRELWPYVDDLVRKKLINEVQRQLQNEMPSVFKDIHFLESRCTLGDQPVRVPRAEVVPKKEDSSILGEYRNLAIKAEVLLENACDIALAVDVARGIFGHAMRLTLDVTEIKLHGSMIFEFVRLAPMASMFGGFRLYFLDPPTVDITMGGSLKRVLHWAFVKRLLLDTITHHLDSTLVFPNLIGCPLMPELQIFQVRAPRPDGLMRVSVAHLHGLRGKIEKLVVILAVGGAERRHLKVGSDEVAAFTFGDRNSQHMLVEVYSVQRSKLFDEYLGNCIAAARIPLRVLLEEGSTSSRLCRFDLQLATKKGRQKPAKGAGTESKPANGVGTESLPILDAEHPSSSEEGELEMGRVPSARPHRSPVKTPLTSTSEEQARVELCVEWRACCTAMPKPHMDFRLRDGGTITSNKTPDIRFLLLVGVYGLCNATSALDGGKCWCHLECIGERHPVSISGAPLDSEKHSKKKFQWSAMTHKGETSKQLVVAMNDIDPPAPRAEEEDWTCNFRHNVTWDESFVFAVTDPELAQVKVDVRWKAKGTGKEPRKVGHTIVDVEPVWSKEVPTIIFEEALKGGDIPHMSDHSTTSRPRHISSRDAEGRTQSFNVASTTRTFPKPTPTVRFVVKAWFLSDTDRSRARTPTPANPSEVFRRCLANRRSKSRTDTYDL